MLSDFQFGYDHAGNRLTTLESSGARVTWNYDPVNQLTGDQRSGTGAYDRSFSYDANGNRLVKVADGEITTSTFDRSRPTVHQPRFFGRNELRLRCQWESVIGNHTRGSSDDQ